MVLNCAALTDITEASIGPRKGVIRSVLQLAVYMEQVLLWLVRLV